MELVATPGLRISCHRLDVAKTESVADFPRVVMENHPGVDLLFNNAGVALGGTFEQISDEEYEWLFAINFRGMVRMTRAFLPLLRASGGAVLNITSDAAVEAYAGWGGYGAAKAALEQASNVLAAEELAVRVWWADPGDLRTDMHQAAFPGEDISDRPEPSSVVPAFVRLVAERLPSGRYRASHLLPVTS